MKAYRYIGKSGVMIMQSEANEAEVSELFVDPEARGRGVARRLMLATCKDADRENVTLYLTPRPFGMYDIETETHYPPGVTHKKLCAFYRSFGFRFKPAPYENRMMRIPK